MNKNFLHVQPYARDFLTPAAYFASQSAIFVCPLFNFDKLGSIQSSECRNVRVYD